MEFLIAEVVIFIAVVIVSVCDRRALEKKTLRTKEAFDSYMNAKERRITERFRELDAMQDGATRMFNELSDNMTQCVEAMRTMADKEEDDERKEGVSIQEQED